MRKLVMLLANNTRFYSISFMETKKLITNQNVLFDEKIDSYRKSISQSSTFQAIELSILMANTCSTIRRKTEFNECLKNLKQYCSSLDLQDEKAIPEKSWNYLIQHFVKDVDFQSVAMHWYKKVMMVGKIASPNIFTLRAMLPLFSENGEVDVCENIIRKLDDMQELNVYSYIHFLNSCIKGNNLERAFEAVLEMKQKGIEPNFGVYIPLLKEATKTHNLRIGMGIYHMVKASSLNSQQLSMSIVLFMLKVGNPQLAIEECETMKQKGMMDLVSWTCLIQARVQMNDIPKAINLLDEMKKNNITPDAKTFSILITACADSNLFSEGKIIHQIALEHIENIPTELQNSIINFYNKCGYPKIAIEECEKLKQKGILSVVSWTCLMQSYIQMNDITKAVSLLEEMKRNQVKPNSTTFTVLMTACADSKLFELGRDIHQVKMKYVHNITTKLQNSIINFYNKCEHPELAVEEFERAKQQGLLDVVSWNCLIQSHIQMNDPPRAISLLDEMKQNNVDFNASTFTILITACADANLIDQGKTIYRMALNHIGKFPIELITAVINFNNKCGTRDELPIERIMKRDRDVALWTCLMQYHIQMNDTPKAIALLDEMKQFNIKPNSKTFAVLITACADSNLFEEGKAFCRMAQRTIPTLPIELVTAVVNFYNKCGNPKLAVQECENLRKRGVMDIALWNCLIQSYVNLDFNQAIGTFNEMKQVVDPDIITYVIILSGCGEHVSVTNGIKIISEIKEKWHKIPEEIVSVMIYFYSRIGDDENAQQLFAKLKEDETQPFSNITYNNMLSCYAHNGRAIEAKQLFMEMKQKSRADEQSLTILLSAFSNCGMVDDAIQLFEEYKDYNRKEPSLIITCAMVDVYSRAGRFEEAELLINGRMDFKLWNTLLGGCRKFNNVELGEKAFKILIEIDESQPSPYVLMSNIYAHHKLEASVDNIRSLMKKNSIKKIPGIVYHEQDGKVFTFISGATEHERYEETETMKRVIYHKIIEAGFIPDKGSVTSTKLLSEQEKIDNLYKHAEKTAIAFAFVLNPVIKKIILTSNLRMCNDCHNAIEYISKVMNVELIVRDANRYHHFKDGKCSCDRYW